MPVAIAQAQAGAAAEAVFGQQRWRNAPRRAQMIVAKRSKSTRMRLMRSRRYSKSEISAKIDGVRRNMSIFAILIRACAGRYDL